MNKSEMRKLFSRAKAAGFEAGAAVKPVAMIVREESSGQSWFVSEGACGFAWVNIRPGNCSFANWLKANKLAGKAWGGGVDIWISEFNQSVDRKAAAAAAMAKVLQEAGIRASAQSRLD